MSRLLRAAAVTAGTILLGMAAAGAANATPGNRAICDFTVTAAGNGMQIFSANFSTVVGTLQTGEVFGISNTGNATMNNIFYRHAGIGIAPSWVPIDATNTGTVFMVEVPNSCSFI